MRLALGASAGVLVLTASMVPGCASGGGRVSPHASTVEVFAEDASGRDLPRQTVAVRAGETLSVNLESLYWQLDGTPDANVLSLENQTATKSVLLASGEHPCTNDIPGTGCGTRTFAFRAVSPGSVELHASRTSCGEVLRCSPDRQNFTLTVRVQR
jgi:hypothetical protein